MQIAPRLIENVITAITKAILPPYAGNLELLDTQIMYLIDLVLEAETGHQGQPQGQAVEGVINLRAEEDNPTEVPAVTEVPATAEAPHKTTTKEDHQDMADTVQHLIDTRSAILPHL